MEAGAVAAVALRACTAVVAHRRRASLQDEHVRHEHQIQLERDGDKRKGDDAPAG